MDYRSVIFIVTFPFITSFLDHILNRSENQKINEKNQLVTLFHAQYTAGIIEDEIRKIRAEDYPWRQKYFDTYGH